MSKGKKFLSLFLAAALAVTGISVGAPVSAEAAAEAAQMAKVIVKYMAVSGDDATWELKASKEVEAEVGQDYSYNVPEDEKVITGDDGIAYEYYESSPDKITVTADDAANKNVITLKYKKKQSGSDKAALLAEIEKVKDYVQADYTPETWQSFKQALDNAQAIAAKDNATASEIADALEKLKAAIAGLLREEDIAKFKTDRKSVV